MTMQGLIQNLAHGSQAQFSNAIANIVTIPPSNGPAGEYGEESTPVAHEVIREHVHIFITDREPFPQHWMFSNTGTNSTISDVDTVLRATMRDEFTNGYNNSINRRVEIFLPFVFNACTSRQVGSDVQNDMALRRGQILSMGMIAAKLSYMLYFGSSAVEEYRRDMRELGELNRQLSSSRIDQLSEEERITATNNRRNHRYRVIMNRSNYGLWGHPH